MAAETQADTQTQSQSRAEWAWEQYRQQYEKWVPWLQATFLRYFTRDNKASYATREELDRTKLTGIEQVDTAQEGLNNVVAGQLGQGGVAQPVGDLASKQGIDRMQRQSKDERSAYGPADAVVKGAGNLVGGVAQDGKRILGL